MPAPAAATEIFRGLPKGQLMIVPAAAEPRMNAAQPGVNETSRGSGHKLPELLRQSADA